MTTNIKDLLDSGEMDNLKAQKSKAESLKRESLLSAKDDSKKTA